MEIVDFVLVYLDLSQYFTDKLLFVDIDESVDEILISIFDKGDIGLKDSNVRDTRRIGILESSSIFLE